MVEFFKKSKRKKGSDGLIAFVLIKCSPHREHEVYNELGRADYIKELHPLFGEYDLIVKISVKDWNQIEDLALNKIRAIDGVVRTETLTGTRL